MGEPVWWVSMCGGASMCSGRACAVGRACTVGEPVRWASLCGGRACAVCWVGASASRLLRTNSVQNSRARQTTAFKFVPSRARGGRLQQFKLVHVCVCALLASSTLRQRCGLQQAPSSPFISMRLRHSMDNQAVALTQRHWNATAKAARRARQAAAHDLRGERRQLSSLPSVLAWSLAERGVGMLAGRWC